MLRFCFRGARWLRHGSVDDIAAAICGEGIARRQIEFLFRRATQSSCSFISENYRSSCVQVYNYHRLLTWDNKLGLHMDIFKVPSCCSCHVHGYADLFPPHQKDPPPKLKESFPGSDFITNSEQKEDYEDVSKLNYLNKFASSFDTSLGTIGPSEKL